MKLAYVVSAAPTRFAAVASGEDLEVATEELARLGFEGVELAIRDPAAVEAGRVATVVDRWGLRVPALGTGQAYVDEGLALSSPDAGVRDRAVDRLLAHVELAAPLGALVIVGLIHGPIPAGWDRARAASQVRRGLARVARAARARGLRVVLEPINRYETNWLNTVEEVLEFLEELGEDNVGVLPDTFHMNIEEADPQAALWRARDRLWHVHVADSNRRAPGSGHLDFRAVLGTLRELGYTGFVSAEVLPLPSWREAAAQTARTVRPLMA